jgi:hypothetical protein
MSATSHDGIGGALLDEDLATMSKPQFVLASVRLCKHCLFAAPTLLARALGRRASVGKALEKEMIWNQCCNEHDCVPQQVNVFGAESNGQVPVVIEHSEASVSKQKFHPVPSSRTWVCYRDPSQGVSDSNIRCSLVPREN